MCVRSIVVASLSITLLKLIPSLNLITVFIPIRENLHTVPAISKDTASVINEIPD